MYVSEYPLWQRLSAVFILVGGLGIPTWLFVDTVYRLVSELMK